MPLDGLLARARMLDLTAKRPLEGIGPEDLDAALRRLGEPIEPGDAAVVWTDHSRQHERPRLHAPSPRSSPDGAAWLAARAGRASWRRTWSGWTSPSTTSPRCTTAFCARESSAQVLTNSRPPGGPRGVRRRLPLKLVGGTGSPLRAFAVLA